MQALTCSVQEAIALCGLSEATIYRMIRRGELRTTKLGRRRLINAASLRELVGAD
jgi:excisionase family DNA binding protein